MELVADIKKYFPIFQHNPGLVYLDNAATTMRHESVIQRIADFDSFENANIHRGVYDLSNKATANFEKVRKIAASLLGKKSPETIAFTSGTTESANIVASSFLSDRLTAGDNVVVTMMEHHANFIPWQFVAKHSRAEFRVVPLLESGDLDLQALDAALDSRTKLLAVTHISNTLGTVNPLEEILSMAHTKDIPVFVDAAQSAAYYELDGLDYDFLAFSGHKIFGPFGTGILYANEKWHKELKPFELGGGIIQSVETQGTTFQSYPRNLDAGTPNVSGVIGLGAAMEYVQNTDRTSSRNHIQNLAKLTREVFAEIPEINVVGRPEKYTGIVSFTIMSIHPHDIASFLNQDNIAVRAGMHCTQPLLDSLGIPATIRASYAPYNSEEDVKKLGEALKELIKFWS